MNIIDCEDLELRFRPYHGTAFRCFYVQTETDPVQLRILVSVQPDRTAHLMPVSVTEAADNTPASQQDLITGWESVLQVAFTQLNQDPAKVAYVLDDQNHPPWSAALKNQGLTTAGYVHQLKRPRPLNRKPTSDVLHLDRSIYRIQQCRSSDVLEVLHRSANSNENIAAKLISLLQNTMSTSEDCMLRTQLNAEDVLTLFACNPNELQMLLAYERDDLVGVLVADSEPGPNRGHIEYVGVHSDCRRKCLATFLLREFQQLIADSALSVAVHSENAPSVSFFRRHNFKRSEQYLLWTRDI